MMLEGIRVLDLSRVIAGPYCAMLLGDLGADVIKVERPGRGDDLRYLRGGTNAMSAPFAGCNRNKRGIAVDLQKPEGATLVFELARGADVVLENFLPGVAAKLGLGYRDVSAANPRVVYASVTGFGQDGPYAKRPGYNTIAQGMSGIMGLTGMPGQPPTRVGASVSDLAGSWVAFGMINAALVHRERTGRGQHLDVNLLASSMALLPDPAAIYLATGERPKREGNRNPALTPAEAYPTKDGWLNLVLLNEDQYARLCDVLGDPELTAERFATNEGRLAHYADFRARMEAALSRATTAEWVERMERGNIAAGPIYEFDEVFEDPQVKHLGLVAEFAQPGLGHARVLGFPARASATPASIRRPAPRIGEHTDEILQELGLAREEIDRLVAAGVVWRP
ncbi:MAG: CoA transferase [Candidatus Rokubacteria bacterium]|nr:CoA transferase [Candidatus Rokubacteria bacterium]